MSAVYGYIPNLVQQQTPAKPAAEATLAVQRTDATPTTTPSRVREVAPNANANDAAQARKDPAQNAEKQTNASNLMKSAGAARDDRPVKLAAESKVAANQTLTLTPADLADKRAEDLAKARKHAEEYRIYKERLESETARSRPVDTDDQNAPPRMDVSIPLPDEIPDRPIPRLGVPTV